MATLILLIIYIAFIGLGIPDSLLGTAWPSIYSELNLPLSYQSFVAVIVSLGTILSSLFSAKVINRYGTNRVAAVSTLLTAIALIGFSVSPNIWFMCILAIPLGIGAGSIDVALNNYVALHYSATQMSFLHCFYGIGVSISPYIMSRVISSELGWRGGFRTAFFAQVAITILLFATLPLWKKVKPAGEKEEEVTAKTLSLKEVLHISGVLPVCILFFTSCGIEFISGSWGSTFLVENKGFLPENAARIITMYYIGITAGRFASGILAVKLDSWKIIELGMIALAIAVLSLFLPTNPTLLALSFFLIGLGNGPLYPNLNYLTPIRFGADVSQSIIGVQMAASYIGVLLAPMFCGILGQMFGMRIFPWYLGILFLAMLLAGIWSKHCHK